MRIRTRKDLGLLLREYRKKKQLTQAELAAQIDVSRRWVVQVEHGKTSPDFRTLLRALRALDADLHVRPRRISRTALGITEAISSRPPRP